MTGMVTRKDLRSSSDLSIDIESSTILLVEDDAAVRASMELFFRAHGHRIVSAASLDQTLAVVGKLPRPELLITDFHLPSGKSGSDVIRCVREALGECLPAIMITGDIWRRSRTCLTTPTCASRANRSIQTAWRRWCRSCSCRERQRAPSTKLRPHSTGFTAARNWPTATGLSATGRRSRQQGSAVARDASLLSRPRPVAEGQLRAE